MTRKHVPLFLSLTLLLLLNACGPEPYLNISPSSLAFSEDGGTQTIQVSANYPWTASVSGTGFSVSPSSGDGDATVTVTAAPTENPDPVSVKLTFYSETLSESVELLQAARSAIVIGDVAKIPSSGGIFEVPVKYNTDFSVEVESSAQSWISFVEAKALTSGKLVFSVEENETTDPRTANVTVKDKSGKVDPITLTFVQEEKKVIEVGDVTEIPAEGGTYEVEIAYNTDFSVKVEDSAKEWLSFVETKALTSGKLVFSIEKNEATDSRTAKVTVKDKSGKVEPITLTFVQLGSEPFLRAVCPEAESLSYEAGNLSVSVEYNVGFTRYSWGDSAYEIFDFSNVSISRESGFKSIMTIPYRQNNTRQIRTGRIIVYGGSSDEYTFTLYIHQHPVMIIASEQEVFIPSGASEFSFRVAEDKTDNYRVECDADWIELVSSLEKEGGAEYVWKATENTGTGMREAQIRVYLNGFDVPDVFSVYQEGPELSVSVTYTGKQVKAPSIFSQFPERLTIWWGDGSSMPYSGGAAHSYSSSGSHTVSVSTKYMDYIERAEVNVLEDGMHIDFSKMRNKNE